MKEMMDTTDATRISTAWSDRALATGACWRTLILVAVIVLGQPGAALAQQWYSEYRAGLTAIEGQQWRVAAERFQAALESRSEQSRTPIRAAGVVRTTYIPGFYLALAYLNLDRVDEAAGLLETVERDGLVVDGDDEFARFADARRQVAIPRATALLADAEKLIDGNRFDDASPLLDEVESLGVLDERLTELRARVAAEAERVAEAEAEETRRAEAAAEEARLADARDAEAARLAEENRLADLARISEEERAEVASLADERRAEEARRAEENRLRAEELAAAAQLERSALLLYYAGDYEDARVDLDQSISAAPTARAYLFLASSRVAAGLLGSEDQTVWLTPSAEDYQRAVEAGVDPETYHEFISPRILQLLTDAPGR